MKIINRFWFATAAPALIGFAMVALCVRGFRLYGWSLFLGLPVAICFISAFCTSFRCQASFSRAYWISVLSLIFLGGMILSLGLDGLICLLMALPLALVLGLIGAFLGWKLGTSYNNGALACLPMLLMLSFPWLVAFNNSTSTLPPIRSVTTTVSVDAPIERVWRNVIAFPKITERPSGVFEFGIAYPIDAHIDGSGVGAIRHCNFSTGSFVEPITIWQEPTHLAFSVSASPPPMKEISFYDHLEAPHLHGHMISRHGEFRLTELNGQVLLQGTTWYTHSLSPQWYWGPISDYLIHRIHQRVLNHIKRVAESA